MEAVFIDAVQDIPKGYSAFAKFLACVIYIILARRASGNGGKTAAWKDLGALLVLAAVLFGLYLMLLKVPLVLWLPVMTLSVFVMYAAIRYAGGCAGITAGYWTVRAFILGEMAAALEWQVDYSLVGKAPEDYVTVVSAAVLLVVYTIVYLAVYVFESRQKLEWFDVSFKELETAAAIGIVTFLLSNLSYVNTNTPFSSPMAREAFNIRTLISLGGFFVLLLYHYQYCENQEQSELSAIRTLLQTQYAQYRQSK